MQKGGKGFKIVLIPGYQMMSDEKRIAALLHSASNAPVFHKVCKFVQSTAYSKEEIYMIIAAFSEEEKTTYPL